MSPLDVFILSVGLPLLGTIAGFFAGVRCHLWALRELSPDELMQRWRQWQGLE